MPILENAKKALRGSKRKAVFNQRVKSMVKTTIDAMRKSPSSENLTKAYSAIDKAVKKNIFHKNKAARYKAQLAKLVNGTTEPKKAKVKKTDPKKVAPKKVAAKKATKSN